MRSYALSAGGGGYRVKLLEVSAVRYAVSEVAGKICDLTGQRWCNALCDKSARRLMDSERTVGEVEITADQLREIDEEFWSIFEGDDEEDDG